MTFAEHLHEIGACATARHWAVARTAHQAWDECDRPDWLLWWLLTDRPDLHPQVVLLMVRELRARTLDRAGDLRYVCNAALDAAEAWALNPSAAKAAKAANAANAAKAAAFAATAAAFAATAAATAATAANAAAFAANAAAFAANAADNAANAADNAAAFAAEWKLWLTAIRSEFECPWRAQ